MKRMHSRKRSKSMIRKTGGGFWRDLLNVRILIFVALLFFIGSGVLLGVRIYKESAKVFPLREVAFSGNTHLSEEELRVISAVNMGEGLLHLSGKEVAERLLKSPWIRDVSVRKDFPDRIMIKIHEASPFAILESKGKAFLIDEKGKMLEEMKDAVPFLPVIAADPAENNDNLVEALQLAKVVKDNKVATERNRVEILTGNAPESISMVMDNVVIKIGDGDYERKLRRYLELEEEIKKRAIPVDYIDLRFANRVVVKPISEVVR